MASVQSSTDLGSLRLHWIRLEHHSTSLYLGPATLWTLACFHLPAIHPGPELILSGLSNTASVDRYPPGVLLTTRYVASWFDDGSYSSVDGTFFWQTQVGSWHSKDSLEEWTEVKPTPYPNAALLAEARIPNDRLVVGAQRCRNGSRLLQQLCDHSVSAMREHCLSKTMWFQRIFSQHTPHWCFHGKSSRALRRPRLEDQSPKTLSPPRQSSEVI